MTRGLRSGLQTCRKLRDEGAVGEPLAAGAKDREFP